MKGLSSLFSICFAVLLSCVVCLMVGTASGTADSTILDYASKITLSPSSFDYDGLAKTPTVSIEGLDASIYDVSYSNNVNAGWASVWLTGKDAQVSGTYATVFQIRPREVAMPSVNPKVLIADGTQKQGIIDSADSAYYTLAGTTSASDCGSYVATANLNDTNNCIWANLTTDPLVFTWSIAFGDCWVDEDGVVHGVASDDVFAAFLPKSDGDGTVRIEVSGGYTPSASVLEGYFWSVNDSVYSVAKTGKESAALDNIALDTRENRAITDVDEIMPFAHSATGWDAGSAANATITYTFNGGASQTLGTYADTDVATWSPTENGTYVFTHTPGSDITATFNVRLPFPGTGSGTEDDPYIVTSAANLRQVAALGGWVRLGADIISDATLSAELALYIDLYGRKLSGTMINNGTLTLLDGVGGGDPSAFTISGSGTVIDNMVKIDGLSFRQRYPWNGLVDISYTISRMLPEKTYAVRFIVTANETTKTFELTNLVNGVNAYVWDAAASSAFGAEVVGDASVKAQIYCTSKKEVTPQKTVCCIGVNEFSSVQAAVDSLATYEGDAPLIQLVADASEESVDLSACTTDFILRGVLDEYGSSNWNTLPSCLKDYTVEMAPGFRGTTDVLDYTSLTSKWHVDLANTFWYHYGTFFVDGEGYATLQDAVDAVTAAGSGEIVTAGDWHEKWSATAGEVEFGFLDCNEMDITLNGPDGYYFYREPSDFSNCRYCRLDPLEDEPIPVLTFSEVPRAWCDVQTENGYPFGYGGIGAVSMYGDIVNKYGFDEMDEYVESLYNDYPLGFGCFGYLISSEWCESEIWNKWFVDISVTSDKTLDPYSFSIVTGFNVGSEGSSLYYDEELGEWVDFCEIASNGLYPLEFEAGKPYSLCIPCYYDEALHKEGSDSLALFGEFASALHLNELFSAEGLSSYMDQPCEVPGLFLGVKAFSPAALGVKFTFEVELVHPVTGERRTLNVFKHVIDASDLHNKEEFAATVTFIPGENAPDGAVMPGPLTWYGDQVISLPQPTYSSSSVVFLEWVDAETGTPYYSLPAGYNEVHAMVLKATWKSLKEPKPFPTESK